MNKICTRCGNDKPLEQFSKDKRQKYGRRPECKTCEYSRPSYLLKSLRFRLNKSKWHKHLSSTLTTDDVVNMGRICHFCNNNIVDGASLHRLDHKGNYTLENTVMVHKRCHAIYGEHNKRPRTRG